LPCPQKKVLFEKFVPAGEVLKYIYQTLEEAFFGGIEFSIETLEQSMTSFLMPTVSIRQGEECLLVKPEMEEEEEDEARAFAIFRVVNIGESTFLGEYKKNIDVDTPGAEDIYDFYHLCDDAILPKMRQYIEQWEAPESHL
jgi:hypothetical protein